MSELEVMSLLLRPVDSATLRAAGLRLRPQDYENVLLERNLEKFCGYPLCHNPPREQKSPYKILYSKCKIYDQRSLLRFCSTSCFKKSAFFAAQLSPEPLWLRDAQEFDINLLGDSLESPSGSNSSDTFTDSVDLNLKLESLFKTKITSLPVVERLSSTMKSNVVERFFDPRRYEYIEGFAAKTNKWLN